jgi:aspartate 1-decarboxylase
MRYVIRANSSAGVVNFHDRRTIDAALAKAAELRDAGFEKITLINVENGVEITDLEQLIQDQSRAE